jgi:trans-2,3-dihydro-3-hydroxyanthranilate isomerase
VGGEQARSLIEGQTWDYVVLDVFTDTPLDGNQLAVFPSAGDLSAQLMQRAARELNLSETAFVLPAETDGDVRLRIFTPSQELPFAGHPILGTAFLLAATNGAERLEFETDAGLVRVVLERQEGRVRFAWLEQQPPRWRPYEHAGDALDALGVARSELPVEAYDNGPLHVYIELPDEASVATLRPDLARLGAFAGHCFNTFAGAGRRWTTRMFGPGIGIDEDPATGSAAGSLAMHLARHGRIRFGDEISIRQGAELGRPSRLHARAEGSAARVDRVFVGGAAVVVAEGRYRLR